MDSRRSSIWVPAILCAWLGICILRFLITDTAFWSVVFPSFFRVLRELPYFFQFPESFFIDLARAGVSLALHSFVGILFLRLFIRLPLVLECLSGLFTGIGLATFVLEMWAIFFLLNAVTVWITLLSLAGLFYWLGQSRGFSQSVFTVDPLPLDTLLGKVFYGLAYGVLVITTLLTFYHALFFPVNYWDALILYINYGEMTYRQGGFPILHCLQVGLGLGANYPHLYPLFQASTAAMTGHWSDLYGQLMPPLASVGCIVGIYCLVLWFYRDRLVAILSALVFRQVTFVTAYFIWESDYSLVMFYTVLYLIFLAWFLQQGSTRSLQPLLCISAVFPHINYLGWIVWPSTALAIAWQWYGSKDKPVSLPKWLGWAALWFGLALTWYIRNWIVTGNPVYAFFPEILGGKNINLEVLRSAEKEWIAHGNGVVNWGANLWERILNSPYQFIANWRMAPVMAGILIPSVLVGWKKEQRFYFISLLLLSLYFFYEYCISGLYLYHIIAVFPIMGVFVGRFLSQIPSRRLRHAYAALLIISGIVPGISYAMIGSKISDPRLPYFARPGLPPEQFNLLAFKLEAPVWNFINQTLEPNAKILSHDNRYHVYRDDIQIIHLDDCELTPLYDSPYPTVHKALLDRGIRYYLYIPDEDTHPITVKLGHRFYLDNPNYFQLIKENPVTQNGEARKVQLYRLIASQE